MARSVPPSLDAEALDLIVTQWERERPDLDPAPMRLFGLLVRGYALTTSYLNELLAGHGLTRGTFDVLSALRRSGRPFRLTPKQLTESLMLSGAGMTSRLDRLEAMSLISRHPDKTDRRSLQIELTPAGLELIDETIPRFVEAQWKVASALGSEDTAALIELLGKVADILEEPN